MLWMLITLLFNIVTIIIHDLTPILILFLIIFWLNSINFILVYIIIVNIIELFFMKYLKQLINE